uniref:Si:ch211-106h11.3 n=1 Tax=Lepisosteus oculatus TaxID=7918 RepID=W5MHL8_LEPOC
CPAVCLCPGTPPRCPPGVSSVPDGCGCCKVCARQLNEDCGPGLPCDHHKGLECNYGNDLQGAHGICRAWRSAGGWSPVRRCVVQTTDWSPCSRTCGMGVSSRITNDNAQCKLDREARLCSVRPCGQRLAPLQCTRTQKAPEPLRLSYAGCRSARLFRPNQCGQCVDGRCCAPQRTRTLAVLFVCPDGERFERAVMMVQSCKCSFECGPLNDV